MKKATGTTLIASLKLKGIAPWNWTTTAAQKGQMNWKRASIGKIFIKIFLELHWPVRFQPFSSLRTNWNNKHFFKSEGSFRQRGSQHHYPIYRKKKKWKFAHVGGNLNLFNTTVIRGGKERENQTQPSDVSMIITTYSEYQFYVAE